MAEFKDAKGDVWRVAITGATVKRARDLLKLDIGRLVESTDDSDQPLLTRIELDIALLVDLLYVVCLPQADDREVSDVDFAERLDGEALYRAHEALLEAFADFFRARRRIDIVSAIDRQRVLVRRAVEIADNVISSEEFSRKMQAELTALGESCARLLRSPEPTPSREHSVS